MTAEIFNFIQAQPQTQAQTQIQGQVKNADNSGSEPGLFDSLMNEYANINQDSAQQVNNLNLNINININQQQQVIIQSGNYSGLDILAGVQKDSEDHEVFIPERYMMNSQTQAGIKATEAFIAQDTGDLVARIMGDKNIAAKIAALPDDKLQEVSAILETIQNPESESELNAGLEKLFALIGETAENNKLPVVNNIPDKNNFEHESDKNPANDIASQDIIHKPEEPVSDSKESGSLDEKDEKEPEENLQVQENANNFAGFAQVQQDNTKQVDNSKPDDIAVNREAPRHAQQTRLTRNNNETVKNNPDDIAVNREAPKHAQQTRLTRNNDEAVKGNPDDEAKNNNDDEAKTDARFANVLNEDEHENENDTGNGDNSSNSNRGSQGREDFAASRNSSRQRNDPRRVSNSSNQTEFPNTTRRTEAHSNFQSFFEDVLSSRRTASTPQPLNLRAAYNLNQSETLRDGIVNVVRFIRADGVHKASMIIDPPAIGRISVELTSSTSGVEASIKVASEQIRQLVQDQLTQLRMNLSQQGVQVAEFTVDVQQDNQQNQGQNQNENQQENTGAVRGLAADEEPQELRVDLQEGLLYWVA